MAVRGERAGARAGWMGAAKSEGRGMGVLFGGGQCCVYVCRLKWWVEDTGRHCTLLFSWLHKTKDEGEWKKRKTFDGFITQISHKVALVNPLH